MGETASGVRVIECAGVRCAGDRLGETHGGNAAIVVRREAVRSLTLKFGYLAPHPLIQFCFGLALTSIAYVPVKAFIDWVRQGGTFLVYWAFLVPIPALGLWMALTAFRRGQFLDVELARGRARLVFRGRVEPAEADAFRRAVEAEWALR